MPFALLLAAGALWAYEFLSLLAPLAIPRGVKLAGLALLLLVSLRGLILQKLGGGMFFSPELPQSVLVFSSWLYSTFFLLFFVLAAKDLVWLSWKLAPFARVFPRGTASAVALALAATLSLYGTWNAMRVPEVNRLEVTLDRLPKALDGMTVALLADLHVSAMNKAPLIEAIVEKTNALSPDVVLLNGDMIDGAASNREGDVYPLRRLVAGHGVYAAAGNHEYYSGYGEWAKKFKELGITMLDNSHRVITANGAQIIIAGVTDEAAEKFGAQGPDVALALKEAPRSAPVILMAHRPSAAAKNASAGVDIQLSGHTHGGMVLGFDRFIARFNGGFVRGWHQVGGMKLYVSPGTLLWNGFALRLGVPSEITLFVLRSKN